MVNKNIIPITPAADHTGKEGYAVKINGAVAGAVTDDVLGVIVHGEATTGKSSVCPCETGEIVYVKLDGTPGTVVFGSRLVITATGTFKLDPGTGSRTQVARCVDPNVGAGAVAGSLVKAILHKPVALT